MFKKSAELAAFENIFSVINCVCGAFAMDAVTGESAAEIPNVRPVKCRFNATSDLALLDLIKHYNPYVSDNKTAAWKDVVRALNETKIFVKPVTDRGVKERFANLVAWFKAQDLRNKSRSGTEEQYGKMEALLTELCELIKGCEEAEAEKKRAATEAQKERQEISKVMKAAGEHGRNIPTDEEDHLQLATGAATSSATLNKDDWMKETGGDERDWEDEVKSRENSQISFSKKRKMSPRKFRLGKSPKKAEDKKLRTSRSNAARSQHAESDDKWLDYFKNSDAERLEFEKKRAADELAIKTKTAEDAKEIRLKELEVEKLRLQVELKKLENDKLSDKNFGL
ncbi:uncharacterized protein LOC129582922 [Paramacrobiotus metropolitanus]|uniref:uncharacterized protein LOC129582922 n=1 Tax=Paramacrobiotus metropolitanus TaxID=2943436 RepID=UPI0024464D70|nr:uncharacterized protein LOC129582922 [Paramacrobiotus metropolitanus]